MVKAFESWSVKVEVWRRICYEYNQSNVQIYS